MSAKKKEVEQLEDSITEEFREELGHGEIQDVDQFVSTGSTLLDYAIANRANGGIPVGRITEISGDFSTGKSLLAYHIMANTQKMGGLAVYLDTERAASREFMVRMGINFDTLITPKIIPSTIEDVFDYIENVVKVAKLKLPNKDKPVVIVWDSVAATQAKEEVEKDNNDTSRIAPEARAMSRCLKKNINILDEGFVTIVCLNQLRTKTNVSFGDDSITPHGKALAFYSSVRLKLKHLKQVKDIKSGRTLAVGAEARVFKNKVAPGYRNVLFPIYYDWGIQDDISILSYLIDELEIVTGTVVKTLKIGSEEFKFRNSEWGSLLHNNKVVSDFVKKTLDESMIIKFDKKVDLDIDTDSVSEVEQVKDNLEEKDE
jgi:recombination protein RecA